MDRNKWIINDIDSAEATQLGREAGISMLEAMVLSSRGINTKDAAQDFLNPDISKLNNPFLLEDMDKAVARIEMAITSKELIIIYGDYDVDGVTSTTIMCSFLEDCGAVVEYYIPDRFEEGYGLSSVAIEKVMTKRPGLIITVDCGISAIDEVELIKKTGIDVIITDHHQCGVDLPDAYAVINPCRPDCMYPFKKLAGVGVAFKLIQAMCINRNSKKYEDYLDLVALGTVADIVALVDENRVIVSNGIRLINSTKNIGLQKLIEVTGVRDGVSTGNISFGLVPRLNAAGRTGTADRAVQLLLTKDIEEASQLAQLLNDENRYRQEIEANIVEEALNKIDAERIYDKKVIVVWADNWNHGVIGIAASKIVEKYHRPCILMTVEDGVAKGSARSIEGFNMFAALNACKDVLTKFGGHELAAGLSLTEIDLEKFVEKMDVYAEQVLNDDMLRRSVKADFFAESSWLTLESVGQLQRLAPFGMGNPTPSFCLRGINIQGLTKIGNDKHAKLKLKSDNLYFDSIWFNSSEYFENYPSGKTVDLICNADINEWNGSVKLQLNIKDIADKLQSDVYMMSSRRTKLISDWNVFWMCVEEQRRKGKSQVVVLNYTEKSCNDERKLIKYLQTIKKTLEICYTSLNSDLKAIDVVVDMDYFKKCDKKYDSAIVVGEWVSGITNEDVDTVAIADNYCYYRCMLNDLLKYLTDSSFDRNDLAYLYRAIKASPNGIFFIADMFDYISANDYSKNSYLRFSNMVHVLCELGLGHKETVGEYGLKLSLEKVSNKKDIENSTLLKSLQHIKNVCTTRTQISG